MALVSHKPLVADSKSQGKLTKLMVWLQLRIQWHIYINSINVSAKSYKFWKDHYILCAIYVRVPFENSFNPWFLCREYLSTLHAYIFTVMSFCHVVEKASLNKQRLIKFWFRQSKLKIFCYRWCKIIVYY